MWKHLDEVSPRSLVFRCDKAFGFQEIGSEMHTPGDDGLSGVIYQVLVHCKELDNTLAA